METLECAPPPFLHTLSEQRVAANCKIYFYICSWGTACCGLFSINTSSILSTVTRVSLSAQWLINCLIYTLHGWFSLLPNYSSAHNKGIAAFSAVCFKLGLIFCSSGTETKCCSASKHHKSHVSQQHLFGLPTTVACCGRAPWSPFSARLNNSHSCVFLTSPEDL